MRWTIIGPTFPYKGGISQHTTELAHRLVAAGHDVTIESWHRQYPDRLYPGQQRLDSPEFEPFPKVRSRLSWNRPDSWLAAGRRIRESSDVVVCVLTTPIQFPMYEVMLGRTRAGAHERSVLALGIAHNVLPHEARRVDPYLARRVFRRLDAVLTHSNDEASLATELGANSVTTARLPFFFRSEAPPPAPPPRARIGRLSFVGFVRPYKGLDVLLEALRLTSSQPSLTVRGEFWEDIVRYQSMIRERGLDTRCELKPGYADEGDLVATIDNSDALVIPYRSATGTLLPQIAFSRGTPVIATDVGDLSEQVRHGVDGLICAPNDPEALAASIDDLYTDSVLSQLQIGVRPPDVDTQWSTYLASLMSLMGD